MKKLFLLPILFAFVTSLTAQISGVGLRPGISLSTYKLSRDWSDSYDAGLRSGASVAGFVAFVAVLPFTPGSVFVT